MDIFDKLIRQARIWNKWEGTVGFEEGNKQALRLGNRSGDIDSEGVNEEWLSDIFYIIFFNSLELCPFIACSCRRNWPSQSGLAFSIYPGSRHTPLYSPYETRPRATDARSALLICKSSSQSSLWFTFALVSRVGSLLLATRKIWLW